MIDWIIVGLLGWQVFMPANENGKYTFEVEPTGTFVRMNTRTGAMQRCTADLKCGDEEDNQETGEKKE